MFEIKKCILVSEKKKKDTDNSFYEGPEKK